MGTPAMEAPLWNLIPKVAAAGCQAEHPSSVVLSPEQCHSPEFPWEEGDGIDGDTLTGPVPHASCCSHRFQ